MTSSNETGQGIGSTATEVGEDVDPSFYRDDSPGTDPGTDGTVAPKASTGDPARDARTSDGEKAAGETAPESDAQIEGKASEKTTQKAERPAVSTASKVDSATKTAPRTDAADPEAAKEKPIPGGIWRSAYEAGAAAPSSRYVTSAPASEEKDTDTPKSAPTLGSAVANASKPQTAAPDESDVDDSTHPRTPGQTPLPKPPSPPSDAWQRVPAAEADSAPTIGKPGASTGSTTGTEPTQSGAAPVAAAAGAGVAAGAAAGDTTTGVKQGAVKAAQAALAAARNAAKKVSSAMPESPAPAKGAAQAPATPPPAPPEMHYTAGAVRGTASVPEEATVPVGRGTSSSHAPEEDTTPAPESGVTPRTSGGPRRVRLAISRIDPWSVMKLAFLLSVAVAIMTVVATAVFWSVIDSLGVFAAVEQFVADAIGSTTEVDVMQYVEFERVVSLSTLVAICNVVLMTALATILTFLYNITSALVGGVHMTLTDD